MTTLALADGARLLGIHPKTLCHWLKEANMPLAAHLTDARIKCVTLQQIQQLAVLHDRPLQSAATARRPASQGSVRSTPPNQDEPFQTVRGLSASFLQEAGLIEKLSQLETQVAMLQEQLAHLSSLLIAPPLAESGLRRTHSSLDGGQDRGRHRPHPAESRRRPVLPLIEYGAAGSYVVICPKEGELSLVPDSPEWFAWLASLSSFRFVGRLGRFSATRVYDHGPKRSWIAYRCFHQHTYKHYLGTTERLTIAVLEQMAAELQSDVTSL